MTYSVLMYHELREARDFNPERPSPIDVKQSYTDVLPSMLFVTVEQFTEQMAYLREQNYYTLSLEEIREHYATGKPLPERSVLLTFDDCFQSVRTYALPVLRQYGLHAVAFVVTGWLHDQARPFDPDKSVCMASSELADMSDVFEFANHTNSMHRRYGPEASDLLLSDNAALAADLKQCNAHPVIQAGDVFAYPFGLYDARNMDVLRQAGFKLAFTTEPGRNALDSDPLRLRRNVVPYVMDMERFKQIL